MITLITTINSILEHEGKVHIETSISEKGLPTFEIFGLVNRSIEESKKRIISALESTGISFPLKNIIVNLSPAEIPKRGTHYDLAIAVTILNYTSSVKFINHEDIFIGELSLDGNISITKDIEYLLISAQKNGFKKVFMPRFSHDLLRHLDMEFYFVNNIKDLLNLEFIQKENLIKEPDNEINPVYFQKIISNYSNKKILGYSLAGKHHLMLTGFPGSGKSLLVNSAKDLLPNLSIQDSYEVAETFSYLKIKRSFEEFYRPPFRSPHSSSSYASIFGSAGKEIIPGEVSIAHKGVLFMDEFPEFNRTIIEGLRQPLEDKVISISRSSNKRTFNSDFIFIAAMNPCKCGYFNHPEVECKCLPVDIRRYQNRISGPILDRVDINLNFDGFFNRNSLNEHKGYSYEEFTKIKNLIKEVRDRLDIEKHSLSTKSRSDDKEESFIQYNITDSALKTFKLIQNNYSISNRKFFKLLNLAKTISYFNGQEKIDSSSLSEAVSLTKFLI